MSTPTYARTKLKGVEEKAQRTKVYVDPMHCGHITTLCPECAHLWEYDYDVEYVGERAQRVKEEAQSAER